MKLTPVKGTDVFPSSNKSSVVKLNCASEPNILSLPGVVSPYCNENEKSTFEKKYRKFLKFPFLTYGLTLDGGLYFLDMYKITNVDK